MNTDKRSSKNGNRKLLQKVLTSALSGEGAHILTREVFAGLDWKLSGFKPDGVSHSIFQLLKHMDYWQSWVVMWLDGKNPMLPKHARNCWPEATGPRDQQEWKQALEEFHHSLDQLERHSRTADLLLSQGQKTQLEMLQTIASHTSYHAGQVVVVRQLMGSWPPPSRGLTW